MLNEHVARGSTEEELEALTRWKCKPSQGCMTAGVEGSLRGHFILAEVINVALTKCKEGVMTAIVEHLSATQMKPVVMRRWLRGLALCVSRFTKDHGRLVNSTLKFVWYDKDPETVDFYIEYLTTLLSAQAYHLRIILANLTQHLWAGHGEEEGAVMGNIHRTIQAVLAHTPLAASVLMQLITKGYPFKGKGVQIQELALRNVLYVCPSLRLELVMLTVDVSSQGGKGSSQGGKGSSQGGKGAEEESLVSCHSELDPQILQFMVAELLHLSC